MRRIVKLTVSLIVWLLDWILESVRKPFSRRPERSIILYYHSVECSQRLRFAHQMEALVRYSSPASPADGTHQASDGRNVAVTFDDGFVSVLENAIPEMESRAIPCVLFVPTGSIGRNAMWLKNSKSGSGSKLVISRKLLTELKNKSAFIIGSHSVTHADLTSLSEDEAWRELVDSKSVLEEILGRKIDLFSFPHGMYNTHLITMARRAGYRKVFSISPSFASESEYVMGRVRADPSDWNLEFALKIRGAYRWLSWVGSGV